MSENAGDYTTWISRQSTDRRLSKHLVKAAEAVEARRLYGTKPRYRGPDCAKAFANYKAAALPKTIRPQSVTPQSINASHHAGG